MRAGQLKRLPVQDMLHDIKGRWTKDGVFAHEVQHVDPELQARSAGLFKECEGMALFLEVVVCSLPVHHALYHQCRFVLECILSFVIFASGP